MTEQANCHSDRIPIREYKKPWKDGGTVCYMTYEASMQLKESCLGCKHSEDDRMKNELV